MNKELEALKRIREELKTHYCKIDDIYKWTAIEDDLDIIESKLHERNNLERKLDEYALSLKDRNKKLTAFELIKNKKVNVRLLMCDYDLDFYNIHIWTKDDELIQEEYDFLKKLFCEKKGGENK